VAPPLPLTRAENETINRGKWRSDAPALLRECVREGATGRPLVEPLVPLPDDYLKQKHSAFYATPLDALLSYLRARTIILVGLTTDACILTTACEIHIREPRSLCSFGLRWSIRPEIAPYGYRANEEKF
jgi:nicotinamidase-related amidase